MKPSNLGSVWFSVKSLMTRRPLVAGTALAVTALVGGCGTNVPTIPPEYLVGGNSSCSGDAYPAGPYGKETGDVLENICFPQGWMDPLGEGADEEKLRPINLSDFYSPDASDPFKIMLLNSSALWCQACKVEHRTLSEEYESRRDDGFVVVSGLYQDDAGDPATVPNLVWWVKTFGSTYPMALDPESQFGSGSAAPLNFVIDLRTMEILRIFVGDQAAAMWGYIDQELKARR